jgi:hypothetical protein
MLGDGRAMLSGYQLKRRWRAAQKPELHVSQKLSLTMRLLCPSGRSGGSEARSPSPHAGGVSRKSQTAGVDQLGQCILVILSSASIKLRLALQFAPAAPADALVDPLTIPTRIALYNQENAPLICCIDTNVAPSYFPANCLVAGPLSARDGAFVRVLRTITVDASGSAEDGQSLIVLGHSIPRRSQTSLHQTALPSACPTTPDLSSTTARERLLLPLLLLLRLSRFHRRLLLASHGHYRLFRRCGRYRRRHGGCSWAR